MKTRLTDKEQVTEHIRKLEPILAEIVETLRQIILNTDKEIGERIKWNNPSFYYTGEMREFDPKEYKRDLKKYLFRQTKLMIMPLIFIS